jgi:Holliday junction DNA helicase RuvA|tara:strand:+ start:2618 stop:3199 length:582 start_codon:yes stop_codon:yes gene_type:complete
MITQLKGRMVEKSPTEVVIDCNGVGYLVNISLNTFSKLSDSENISLFTHLQVKEDSHTLFGFFEKTERDLFRQLISVSGIGASTARTMLSSLSPNEIQSAIISGNVSTIQSVKGIGLKTAQRVIIDLKDKVSLISENDQFIGNINNTNQDEALSALEVLGYSRKQTSRVIEMLLNDSPELTVEELIKGALKKM